ncbi:MAG: hypothetical protein Q4D60_09410 [Eubacteriales bacterium]|nr:hypothetical protein [Eubacteriales bacterium]
MLRKLIKYEWKSSDRLFFTIHGFILVFGIVARLFMEACGGIEQALSTEYFNLITIIGEIINFGFIFSVSFSLFFTHIFIGCRFYKSVFTDQGYLTNTLPVTPNQIILSKGITGLAWTVINFLTVILSCLLYGVDSFSASEMFRSFGEFFRALYQAPACMWCGFTLLLLAPFLMIATLYFSVAVGNLVANHKIGGAVITYFITNFILQILYLLVCASTLVTSAKKFSGAIETNMSNHNMDMVYSAANHLLCPWLIASIILTAVIIAAFWLVTKWIMTKKLNLQ